MIQSSYGVIGLLLLLACLTAAGSESDLRPRAVRSSVCQEHTDLHSRMDAVEKRMEGTVENLEAELAALLDAIHDTQWSPLLDKPGQTAVDILQDPEQRGRS
ncbi:Placenta-specific protein 9 [Oryzias melastigma]|uniref:Placenta-specific protein 9 n=1 Tax=Oryzias melastigma TaxID=30732 RepID=A0A834L0U6_ORYME|nr:placenta-specific protein 9 [Oryzias melastigma]KAF6737442.1 Placenta-specific protein 9 [Oryzias melastigma]